MTDLEDGARYWVKTKWTDDQWEVGLYLAPGGFFVLGHDDEPEQALVVGPKIEPPE